MSDIIQEQMSFEFETRTPIKGYPELHWTGKRPYKSTVYYPAQLKESYVQSKDGWLNKIYWGDNLQVMSHLLKDYRGKIDLIYIDPPFDSKADYKKKIKLKGKEVSNDQSTFEEKQYGDIWTNDEYLQFIGQDKGSYRFKAEVTKDYVLHHYGEDINLDVLAKRLFLSAGYLSMIFKKETGENLNQFIKNVRLEKAAEQLTGTDLTVGEICSRVGFANMSYFSKCFRRQYGVTPDAYRKQEKKDQDV